MEHKHLGLADSALLKKEFSKLTEAEQRLFRLRAVEAEQAIALYGKDFAAMVASLLAPSSLNEKPKATDPFEEIDIFAEIEPSPIRPLEKWKVEAKPGKRRTAWDD